MSNIPVGRVTFGRGSPVRGPRDRQCLPQDDFGVWPDTLDRVRREWERQERERPIPADVQRIFDELKNKKENETVTDQFKQDFAPGKRMDVSGEAFREYVYGTGSDGNEIVYRIDEPVALFVKRKDTGDSHRVIDASGMTHYVPTGWLALRWRGKDGVALDF